MRILTRVVEMSCLSFEDLVRQDWRLSGFRMAFLAKSSEVLLVRPSIRGLLICTAFLGAVAMS